jgi:hypothetical protein
VLGIVKSTPFEMKVKGTDGENRTVTAGLQ